MIGFNIKKAIQATAHLLKRKPGKRDNYMRVLKLLYLAERTSLKERGAPICGDAPWAMRRGPVLGTMLDLIKGNDLSSDRWEKFIRKDEYDIALKSDPGNFELSPAELQILDRTSERYRGFDEWSLVHWCHKNVPEYEKIWKARGEKNRVRIPLEDVLEAVGRDRSEAAEIIAQINAHAYFRKLFGDHIPSSMDAPL